MKEELGEAFVIRAFTAQQKMPPWVSTGPGDDAAVLRDGQVLTTDLMVEGIHFDEQLSPESLAWKLIAVNASDVAACGARPTWAMLSIALPDPLNHPWVDRFSGALMQRLQTLGITLVGGDTTRSPGPILLNLCMAGHLEHDALLRSGAKPEQDIWVSGTLGDASGGFHLQEAILREKFERPTPPLALGPALAKEGLATAAMDLSDGLLQDLQRLCAASDCGADVDSSLLPTSEALQNATPEVLPHQLSFGEDYELLFTARDENRHQIETLGRSLGLRLTRIGRTSSSNGLRIPGCETIEAWTHFKEENS